MKRPAGGAQLQLLGVPRYQACHLAAFMASISLSAGRLLGACETAGELFIMMEYLDGGTLVDLL